MYDVWPNATLGFHGCDQSVAESLLNNPDDIKISREKYDWLGHGMYLWENNIERAKLWAENKKQPGDIKEPAVIGVVLQLGYCCDLLDSKYIQTLKSYFELIAKRYSESGLQLPVNKDLRQDEHKDKILRELDCAVIQFMHSEIFAQVQIDETKKGFTDLRQFDSVRGAFTEGGPAYTGAGILEKTHIQVCIRNLNCVKGFLNHGKKSTSEIGYTTTPVFSAAAIASLVSDVVGNTQTANGNPLQVEEGRLVDKVIENRTIKTSIL